MDIFIPYLLLLLILPISLYLISFFQKDASGDPKNLPPGSSGWPILGENVEFAVSGLSKFVSDRMGRYSADVFRTSLLGEKVVVFCGAQGNKLIFNGGGKIVTPWLPLSLKRVLLPADYGSSDYKEKTTLYSSFIRNSLKQEALKQYVPVMDAMARQQLLRWWTPNPVVKALPLIDRYIFELTCRLFMNVVDEESLKKIWDLFTPMRNGMMSLPIDLPGTAFNRGIKAGKLMRWEMTKIAEARKKELMAAPRDHWEGEVWDLLTKTLLLTDEDTKSASDEMIGKFFAALMVASHDATATALTSVVYYLAQLPHVYQNVLQEQMTIAKSKGAGENLTWEDVEKMKYSWNVAREAMRLAPPAPGTFKEAMTDISYAGFTIYKGMKAFWTPHSTHKSPDYFPEPEKFDPSRFEGSGPAPYTFVPFGGGARICPGRVFAKLAILVFMHNLVTSFRFEKAVPDEKLAVLFAPKPTHGLHLRLYPRNTK